VYKSIILPLAKEDIKRTAKWYNQQKAGLGKRFTTHVRIKVRYICENPESIAIRYKSTRTALLDTFPYMIHFSIDPENKVVIISAVFSTKEDPEKWTTR
jgi:hypothetical protein